MEKKAAEAEALEKAKAAQRAAGKMAGMTGKDMFEFGGELYEDDDEAGDDDWDISRLLARYVSHAQVAAPSLGDKADVQREDDVRPEDDTPAEVADGVEQLEIK